MYHWKSKNWQVTQEECRVLCVNVCVNVCVSVSVFVTISVAVWENNLWIWWTRGVHPSWTVTWVWSGSGDGRVSKEQSKVRMRRGKETTETIHHNIRPLSAITDWRPSATAKQLQQAYDLTRSTSIPSLLRAQVLHIYLITIETVSKFVI